MPYFRGAVPESARARRCLGGSVKAIGRITKQEAQGLDSSYRDRRGKCKWCGGHSEMGYIERVCERVTATGPHLMLLTTASTRCIRVCEGWKDEDVFRADSTTVFRGA